METNEILNRVAEKIITTAKLEEFATSLDVGDTGAQSASGVVDLSAQIGEDFLASDRDTRLAKAMATAAIIAQKRGVIQLDNPTVNQFVSIADDASSRIKQAYKIATGELDVEEALDKLVDRAAARATVFAEKAVDAAFNLGTKFITKAIMHFVPQAAPVTILVDVAVSCLKPKVKEAVRRGISHVKEGAKRAIPHLIDKAKICCQRIASRVLNLIFA